MFSCGNKIKTKHNARQEGHVDIRQSENQKKLLKATLRHNNIVACWYHNTTLDFFLQESMTMETYESVIKICEGTPGFQVTQLNLAQGLRWFLYPDGVW